LLEAAGRLPWLADAEKKAYAEWKLCALPETCEAEITNDIIPITHSA